MYQRDQNVSLQNNGFFVLFPSTLSALRVHIYILNSLMYLEIMWKNIQTASHARYPGSEGNEA